MRVSRPPPRFSPEGEVYVARLRRIKLFPDAGDPAKVSKEIRLPEHSIRLSKIPYAGVAAGRGLFLNEKVLQAESYFGETSEGAEKEGQTIGFSSILSIPVTPIVVITSPIRWALHRAVRGIPSHCQTVGRPAGQSGRHGTQCRKLD